MPVFAILIIEKGRGGYVQRPSIMYVILLEEILMKKLVILLSALCSISAFAATINIVNQTDRPIMAGIKYGEKSKKVTDNETTVEIEKAKKMETIQPGKSARFNSWASNINEIVWHDGGNYSADVNINAYSIEATITIYPKGQYDLKPCLTCTKQEQLQGERSLFRRK